MNYDLTILTDHRYVNPTKIDDYTANVLLEDELIADALKQRGLKVHRTNWDDPTFDWRKTKTALFRTTWDYFDRFGEFQAWYKKTKHLTRFINPAEMIEWNLDKHYLLDLEAKGIPVTETHFIEAGSAIDLNRKLDELNWSDAILKPAISGGARHTYRLNEQNTASIQPLLDSLIQAESFLLQPFQQEVLRKGEVAFMVFGGKYCHAILKRAKPGDFRVQDDFGGTVSTYRATQAEIRLAESCVASLDNCPAYARVDVMWDNDQVQRVSELELIEPELWLRLHESAADQMADAVISVFQLLP